MAINLTENVKTYLTYAGIAITSAAVGALILLAGQGINNWRHPKVPAIAVTDDILSAAQGRPVGELREELDTLNGQTGRLTQARDDAQRIVNDAGEGGATAEQTAALEAAQKALDEHNAQIAKLTAQIAVNGVLANADQRAELVNRINNLAPVSQTSEQHQSSTRAATPAAPEQQ